MPKFGRVRAVSLLTIHPSNRLPPPRVPASASPAHSDARIHSKQPWMRRSRLSRLVWTSSLLPVSKPEGIAVRSCDLQETHSQALSRLCLRSPKRSSFLVVALRGGIAYACGIVAAFALGASGVQMGTAFLTTAGSGAGPLHRQVLLNGEAGVTALTKGFTGRLARGIKNRTLDELRQPRVEILSYPLQRALVRLLSLPAEKAGRADLLPLWAGHSVCLSQYEDPTVLLEDLVARVSVIRERERRTLLIYLFPYSVNTKSLDFAAVWQANPQLASLPCGGVPAMVPGVNVPEAAS